MSSSDQKMLNEKKSKSSRSGSKLDLPNQKKNYDATNKTVKFDNNPTVNEVQC